MKTLKMSKTQKCIKGAIYGVLSVESLLLIKTINNLLVNNSTVKTFVSDLSKVNEIGVQNIYYYGFILLLGISIIPIDTLSKEYRKLVPKKKRQDTSKYSLAEYLRNYSEKLEKEE